MGFKTSQSATCMVVICTDNGLSAASEAGLPRL